MMNNLCILIKPLVKNVFSFFKTKNYNYNWGNTDVFSVVGWNMKIYLVSFNRSPFFQALNQNPVKKETLTLGSLKMITCFQVLGINLINKHYKKYVVLPYDLFLVSHEPLNERYFEKNVLCFL